MNRCTKCIIPDSFPGITFDAGLCTFCRSQETTNKIPTPRGKDALLKELPPKGKADYDCLVPLSGGKDSSYALHYVVRELGLKPLAASFDHGFVADMAKRNITRLCEHYGVDLVVENADSYRRKIIVEALRVSSCAGRFNGICASCESDLRTFTMRIARQRQIPAVVWGATTYEDSPWVFLKPDALSMSHSFGQRPFTNRLQAASRMFNRLFAGRGIIRKCGTVYHLGIHFFYCIAHNFHNRAGRFWQRLNPYMEVPWNISDLKVIYLYDYIQYDPAAFMKILVEQVGWEAPPDKELRYDCRLHCFDNYQFFKETGITLDGFTLATLARYGRLPREDALTKEAAMQKGLRETVTQMGAELSVDLTHL
jgi:hypothetical protein